MPLPEMTISPQGFAVMFFFAIPWILAAGLLGPLPAAIFGSLSGLLFGIWGTHSIFTVLETAAMALVLSWFFNQNFRTWNYRAFRQPIFAILILIIFYPIINIINSVFISSGSLTGQIDYALSNIIATTIVVSIPLLIGGLLASIVKSAFPVQWGGQTPWQLAPFESSLEARFLQNVISFSFLLMIGLMVGDWIIAGRAARRILEGQMAGVAQIAAEGVPYFLDTGQNLALRIASEIQLNSFETTDLDRVLENEMRSVPFFHDLFVLDRNLETIGGYPNDDFYTIATSMDELAGIELAIGGIPVQNYTLQSSDSEYASIVSFIAAIQDNEKTVQGVLIGRADIRTNPFTMPIITSLESLEEMGGVGFLTNENGRILYHPDPNRLSQTYPLRPGFDGSFYDETAPDGTRQVTYYKQAIGQPWAAVITLPASEFQKSALETSFPLLGMVFVLSVAFLILIRFRLKTVTASLKSLAVETDRIAQGQLDNSLLLDGDDEVGRLRRSFEQMRISLKDRLDELNRLLEVSKGVSSSLEMKDAVHPILEASLATGASSARIVLAQAISQRPGDQSNTPSRFGLGEFTKTYSRFDDQLLAIMENQDRIVLSNPSRTTLLNVHPGVTRPESLVSIALRHEDQYYGTLWVGYAAPHPFTREEVQFLTTLAGQAAVASAKTRLFWTAEFGRQRLAAILSSTPDPVIVTDHENNLLLVNPIAIQVLGLSSDLISGKAIDDIIPRQGLIDKNRQTITNCSLEDKTLNPVL